MPKDLMKKHHPTDFDIGREVIDGLMTAREYERNKPKISWSAQEELMKKNFPRLPKGDTPRKLSMEECTHLR